MSLKYVLPQSEGNVDKSLFERKPDNDHCLTDKGRSPPLLLTLTAHYPSAPRGRGRCFL